MRSYCHSDMITGRCANDAGGGNEPLAFENLYFPMARNERLTGA